MWNETWRLKYHTSTRDSLIRRIQIGTKHENNKKWLYTWLYSSKKYRLTCFKKLPKPFLKKVRQYFFFFCKNWLEILKQSISFIMWWSFSRPTTLFLIGIIAIKFKIIDGSMDSRQQYCYRPSSQQFYAQNVLLHVGLLFSLVEHQRVTLFGLFFGKIKKEQYACQSPPASVIKQLSGKFITHTRCTT